MPQGPFLRKYGVQTTIPIELYEIDGVDLRVDASHAAGDTTITKDEGAEGNTDNGFTDEGTGYSLVLSATEMEAARISVYVVDQTGPKAWLDTVLSVETYGHPSAAHAMDFDDAVRGGLTALPNAAADAAGGLIISDAGGLDADNDVRDQIIVYKLDHLVHTAESDDPADDTIMAKIAAADGDWSTFSAATDALSALRARGDAAWATAVGFSTHTAANVWAVAVRVLTAGTNIVLAKGVGLTGLNDIPAVDVTGGTTVAAAESNIRGADGDDLKDISDEVAALNNPTVAAIVDAVWDELLTGASHNIATSAGRRLREDYAGYEFGAVWIDTVNGIPGTTDFENGTASNPVDSIADALTIAASVGLMQLQIVGGSSIVFAANMDAFAICGHNWTLALGGQSLSGTYIEGAHITGICTGAIQPSFVRCHFGATTLPPCHLFWCGLENTLTMGSAGEFVLVNCHSQVAGILTPVLDFGAGLVASNANLRDYSGGIEVRNMGAGAGSYNMSLEGQGQLIINANCSPTSVIAIRGAFTITNNASGITISQDARLDIGQTEAGVDNAMENAIPGAPTAGSINERIKTLDEDWANAGRLDTILDAIQAAIDTTGVVLTAGERTAIADALLVRVLTAVEATAPKGSVAYSLAMQSGVFRVTLTDIGGNVSQGQLYRSDGVTPWGSAFLMDTVAAGTSDEVIEVQDTI